MGRARRVAATKMQLRHCATRFSDMAGIIVVTPRMRGVARFVDARFDVARMAHSRLFRDLRHHFREQFVKAPLERLFNHVTLLQPIVGHSDIPTIWIKGTEDGETNDEA